MASRDVRSIRAKVVLVGAPGVGKTSLVRQFVHSIFSEDYHSTLGVKVDRKKLNVEGCEVTMLLWDMHGETDGLAVPDHYLRGALGSLAVIDSTRPDTAQMALDLHARVNKNSPMVEQLVLANKLDLDPDWDGLYAATDLDAHQVVKTSALTGEGVEEAFGRVATSIWQRATS